MNNELIRLGKIYFKKFVEDEITKGEKREDIRLVDIDWEDKELAACINEMIEEGIIERTENREICIVTERYYENLTQNN